LTNPYYQSNLKLKSLMISPF